MNWYKFQKKYLFSTVTLLAVLILSSFIFTSSKTEGEVKGIETVKFFGDNAEIDPKLVAVESFASALTQLPVNPSTDPLYNITGEFQDVNNDGTKEWLQRQNWQGASGWSDQFVIYQFKNWKLNKIFDLTVANSVLIFDNAKIYQVEPYYTDDQPHYAVDKLLVTIFDWQNDTFIKSGQEIVPIDLSSV